MDWFLFALSLCVVGFFTGCCCGEVACTGSDEGDCCASTLPASLDVTLPDVWANGDRPCTTCGDIGGTTYTLNNTTATDNSCGCFGGSSAIPNADNYWVYEAPAFCQGDCVGIMGCADFDFRLQIVVSILCEAGVCTMRLSVNLIGDVSCAGLPGNGSTCCDAWRWQKTFPAGTDCDTEVWTLDYSSQSHNTAGCDAAVDDQCVFSGTSSTVDVTKT